MNIEAELTARYPAGAKLHTGRSRNDQVATAMRPLAQGPDRREPARRHRRLQSRAGTGPRATSPSSFPATRICSARSRCCSRIICSPTSRCWSAITSGSPIAEAGRCPAARLRRDCGQHAAARPRVRAQAARLRRVSENSMDAVSDRDFIVEYNAACALLAVHLSRLAEDLILWSTRRVPFHPHRRRLHHRLQPDAAEEKSRHRRAGARQNGRVIGNLVALLTLLKGLPMTYNRDLQEDKERLFDTAETVQSTLLIFAEMLGHIEVNADACKARRRRSAPARDRSRRLARAQGRAVPCEWGLDYVR
jgi:argininosuccinate lyase